MAEGDRTPDEPPAVRPPAPHADGPLGSSGEAPPEPLEESKPTPVPTSPPQPMDPPSMTGFKQAAENPLGEYRPAPVPASPPPSTRGDLGLAGGQDSPPGSDAPVAGSNEPAPTQGSADDAGTGEAGLRDGLAQESAGPISEAAASAKSTTEPGRAAADEPGAGDATKSDTARAAGVEVAQLVPAAKAGDAATADDAKVGGAEVTKISDDAPVVVTVRSSSGRRVTRVLRHANPIRVAKSAGRTTHAWAKRPTGRFFVPAIIGILLVGAAGTAGAYLVPEALRSAPSPSATPGFPLDAAAPAFSGPSGGGLPSATAPATPDNTVPAGPAVAGARPADALNGWAQGVGTRVGIPVVAVQAYGYAELVAARTAPNCHLSWTTLAAIAKVESAHGSANGAVLGADGSVQPPIFGLPLDGRGGRQEIRDTDQGTIDGDTQYDRAIGPLQFIPQTWRENAVDADNNGASDPNDIDDASLAAALYLCKSGRDMAKADAWWDAILSYNAVRPYAQKVFDAANEYGQRSRV